MTATRRTRISAYAILIDAGKILLCRCSPGSDPAGFWTLPGGGIDFGEDPAAAVVREVSEETGFDIAVGTIITINSKAHHANGIDHHAIRILYDAKIIGGELTSEINGSTDLAEWLPLHEIAKYPLADIAELAVKIAGRGSSGSQT
jgi:8-oxo-dGTP diphosphatase